jgi:hypothetical protein
MQGQLTMELSKEIAVSGYMAQFGDRTRAAHLATLLHARATQEDRWPNVGMVRTFAKLFGVSMLELGAFFGLLMHKDGNREVWVDISRGPVNPAHALALLSQGQIVALGYMKMLTE